MGLEANLEIKVDRLEYHIGSIYSGIYDNIMQYISNYLRI